MLILLAIAAAAWGGSRALRVARDSLRALPRRNEDMVFY